VPKIDGSWTHAHLPSIGSQQRLSPSNDVVRDSPAEHEGATAREHENLRRMHPDPAARHRGSLDTGHQDQHARRVALTRCYRQPTTAVS
jgi:hypothetical protein